jgi:hypothetical protein
VTGLIIYDFDGVIAESEVLANTVLAQIVTELGVPTTLLDSYRLYMGKRFSDVIAAVEASVGRALPATFAEDYQARTLARFRKELQFVDGARDYIKAFTHIPHCIAHHPLPTGWRCAWKCLGFNPSSARMCSAPQPWHEANHIRISFCTQPSRWECSLRKASFSRTARLAWRRQSPQGWR